MKVYITDNAGEQYEMPVLLSWSFVHTLGEPADSFEICCLYDASMLETLENAVRLSAEHEGEAVFSGVIDEYQIDAGARGCTVSVSGRGLAALLLDNEAEAAEYGACTLSEVLERHVRPYGIERIEAEDLLTAFGFSVESGASQWKVLKSFTMASGGIVTRFSRDGTLVISERDGALRRLDERAAYELRLRDKRYGVISEVLVKNALLGTSETVKNDEFIQRGGCARRVVNVPKKTGADAMRYTGFYQLEESKKDSRTLRLTVPELFAAFPNDLIELDIKALGVSGVFRVSTSECWADAGSSGTRLELIPH